MQQSYFNFKYSRLLVLPVAFLFLLSSCGDDDPVSVEEEPPALPTFENAQPDLSFFDENNPSKAVKLTTNHFNEAQLSVLMLSIYTSMFQAYSGFFLEADPNAAEFNDGRWEWNYNYAYDNASMSMQLAAQESADDVHWSLSYSIQDGEVNIQDYTIVEGNVANDGNSGNWTFNVMNTETNEEIPALVSDFDSNEDGTQQEVETRVYGGENGELVTTINFTKDEPEFTMVFTDIETGEEINTFWNNETNEGYIQDEESKRCWDSEFQDIEC